MITVPRLASVPGVDLAPPAWPGRGGRPWRRRVALGLAAVVLAAAAVLAAGGTIALPWARSATTGTGRQAPPGGVPTTATQAPTPGPARAPARPAEARPASERVVQPVHSAALFPQHSWYVRPPPPKPVPPPPAPPPPDPTAPPFPFTFVGSFAPDGDAPVFFLARGDRVIDAHVGDRLDGVYQFESAGGGQLVFVYLPLNVRQHLAAGVTK